MKQTEISWKSGTVVYWDLDEVNEEESLGNQIDCLKEDLVQVYYRDGKVLDVGWYPSFDPDGKFVVYVIENSDWEAPVFRAIAKDIQSLREQISIAISQIE